MRRRQMVTVALPGDDLPMAHGTPSSYTNRACRCADCRDAWSAYVREHRKRRAKKRADPPDVPLEASPHL